MRLSPYIFFLGVEQQDLDSGKQCRLIKYFKVQKRKVTQIRQPFIYIYIFFNVNVWVAKKYSIKTLLLLYGAPLLIEDVFFLNIEEEEKHRLGGAHVSIIKESFY